MTKKIVIFALLWTNLASVAVAQTTLTRAEATAKTIESFNLKNKNIAFIDNCQSDLEICLFSFLSRTKYELIDFESMQIYPDVDPKHKYFEQINLATYLDLTWGYYSDQNSPFYPENNITLAEALKLALGASGLVEWKENFELSSEIVRIEKSYNTFVNKNSMYRVWNVSSKPKQWWKIRYLLFALENGIIDPSLGNPDQSISKAVFLEIIEKTKELATFDEKAYITRNTAEKTFDQGS